MIVEDYVSFEQAIALKEKGFNCECYTFYNKEDTCHSVLSSNLAVDRNYYKDKIIVSCPSLSLTQKWLREEKNIYIRMDYSSMSMPTFYKALIFKFHPFDYECSTGCYSTYEEALSSAIDKALELI